MDGGILTVYSGRRVLTLRRTVMADLVRMLWSRSAPAIGCATVCVDGMPKSAHHEWLSTTATRRV